MNLEELEEKLGYSFQDSALLEQALSHRSWAEEEAGGALNNERLEYLGDAVLELAVTQLLYERYVDVDEGVLSKLRSALVRTESLVNVARRWEVGRLLRLGRGEEATGGRQKGKVLANATEAVLGAIFLDGGYLPCKALVSRVFAERLEELRPDTTLLDPKSELQQLTMARWKILPVYRLIEATGPPHDRRFTCEVHAAEYFTATGTGPKKRIAERIAARTALLALSAQEEP